MASILLIGLVIIMSVLNIALLVLMLIYRSNAEECLQNYNPFCPSVLCADKTLPKIVQPADESCPDFYINNVKVEVIPMV